MPRAACRMPCAMSAMAWLRSPPKPRARVRHQKIRAQRHGAHQFVVKRLNRSRAHHPVGRRQIDQIIVMDDHRTQAQLGAARPKPRGVSFRDALPPRGHMRGLAEKICRAFAPSFEAVSRDPAMSPAIEV